MLIGIFDGLIARLRRKKHHKPTTGKPHPKPVEKLPVKGCDYVAGPPVSDLRKAGIKFVGRYLSTAGNPKNLTKGEAELLHKGGIDIVLIFETTGNRALAGAAAGKVDAKSALEQARALGAPAKNKDGSPVAIYFAVDFDAQPSEMAAVTAYFRGVKSVLAERTGGYGGINTVAALAKAKVCHYFMQAYAWSGGKWFAGNHIEQYANGQKVGTANVDLDRAVKVEFGAWKA